MLFYSRLKCSCTITCRSCRLQAWETRKKERSVRFVGKLYMIDPHGIGTWGYILVRPLLIILTWCHMFIMFSLCRWETLPVSVLRAQVPHKLQQAWTREEVPGPSLGLCHPPALPGAGRDPGQPQCGAQCGVQIVNTLHPSSFPALTHTATNFAKARLEKQSHSEQSNFSIL